MRRLLPLVSFIAVCMTLTALSASAQTPVITTHPAHDTVCARTSAMFTVAATHSPSIFIWEVSRDAGTSWDTVFNGGLYSGANDDTLMVFGADTLSGRMYKVTVGNDSGFATSNSAMLTVTPILSAGTISGSAGICLGGMVTYTSSGATGGSWSNFDTTVATIDASGMVMTRTAGIDTVYYTVSNSCGSATARRAIHIDTNVTAASITGPTSVCVRSFITLGMTISGGTWSASNGNATVTSLGVVTGVNYGMDTISYSFSNACGSFTRTRTVTIDTVVSIAGIAGPSAVCVGSWVNYTSSTTGGTWVSGDASIANVDASGNVTGRNQGMTMISYNITNACGTASANDTIWVSRRAAAILGRDSLGIAITSTYTDSAINGTWSSSDTTVARVNATTGAVTTVAAGTFTLNYSVTNVCGTTTATKVVTVGAAPSAGTITGGDSVCVGATIRLSSTVTGGTWSIANANASINDTGLVTGLVGPEMDTVYYTVTNGFGTTVLAKEIYVNTLPVITITPITTINLGTAYTLVATPTGGTWISTQPTKVVFISSSTFVVMQRGVVDLIYTKSNTCGTSRDTFTVNVPVINAVNGIAQNEFQAVVAPNPNQGAFNLSVASAHQEAAQITVLNAVGSVVASFNTTTNTNKEVSLDLAAGVYIMQINTAHGNTVAKFEVAK